MGELFQWMRAGEIEFRAEPDGDALRFEIASLAGGHPQGGITIRTRWVPWD